MPILPLHQTAGAQLAWLSLLPDVGWSTEADHPVWNSTASVSGQIPETCINLAWASKVLKPPEKQNNIKRGTNQLEGKRMEKIADTQHSQDECWNLLESYTTLNLTSVKTIKNIEKKSVISHSSLCNTILLIRKVPAFLDTGQSQQNWQHLQKSQHSDKKFQPLHTARAWRARQQEDKEFKKVAILSQSRSIPCFLQTYARKLSSNGCVSA